MSRRGMAAGARFLAGENGLRITLRVMNLLFPPRCPFCHALNGRLATCSSCRAALPYTEEGLFSSEGYECTSGLYYEGLVKQVIQSYKFRNRPVYALPLSEFTAAAAVRFLGRFDAVSWVPVSAQRRKERGYDQAELLARETACRLGVPLKRTLTRPEDRTPQTTVAREERRAHVRGAFRAMDEGVAEGRFLLVDDVFTTGSTFAECAGILTGAGAAAVAGVALAKTRQSNG